MNSEENVINQLKADKAVLEAQLVQVRADYNALNMIQTNVNNSLLDANKEIRQLKTELALKNNEITVLSNPISNNVSFFSNVMDELSLCSILPFADEISSRRNGYLQDL